MRYRRDGFCRGVPSLSVLGRRMLFAAGVLMMFLSCEAYGQKLSFANHREIKIPDYALLRIGPFYSDVIFAQSAGYRYTSGSGAGTDFLFANQRGVIKKDGSEFPLITSLQFQNYLLVTRHVDVDFSARITSEQYPNRTQESRVYMDLADEGAFGNLTTEIELTPFLKLFLYDNAVYKTDYVDTRGFLDEQGGSEYEYFRNKAGFNMDWLMDQYRNLNVSAEREDNFPADDKFASQEYTMLNENVVYEQVVSVFMTAGLSAGASQSEYTFTNRSDISSYRAVLFANADVTRWTRGSASIGYSQGSISSYDKVAAMESDREPGAVIGGVSLQTQLSRDMSHALSYSRSQRNGFNTTFEVVDSLRYAFTWKGDFTSVVLSSQNDSVVPNAGAVNAYSSWRNAVAVSRELTKFMTLNLTSTYDMRQNKAIDIAGVAGADVEWQNNYDTWLTRLGTSFGIMKELDFTTYIQHVERISDAPELDYKRDMVAMMFMYRHQF